MNKKLKKTLTAFVPVITIIVLIFLWYIIAKAIDINLILPTPLETLLATVDIFKLSAFYKAVFNTTLRAIISFLIALAFGILFAFMSAKYRFFKLAFYPLIILVRATPTMSVIFLCLIWFKSNISPMIVSFAIIFPVLYSSVLSSVEGIDKELIEMSTIYNVSKKDRLLSFYLPSVSRRVYSDAISSLSLNVKLIIAAEALAQTSFSIGREMQVAKINLETATLFAYTIAAIILSYLLELLIKLVKYLFTRAKKCQN